MSDTSSPTPEIDPSGLFSTYKSQPEGDDAAIPVETGTPTPLCEEKKRAEIRKKTFSPTNIPHYETSFQKTMYFFQISINGCVRGMKVFFGFLLGIGALFIVSLATNTTNQAVDIINHTLLSKLGTHITLSGEVGVEEPHKVGSVQTEGLTSNVINTQPTGTTSATSEALVAKRRAILEARKAAKALEEKQKIAEQI